MAYRELNVLVKVNFSMVCRRSQQHALFYRIQQEALISLTKLELSSISPQLQHREQFFQIVGDR